jgi:hypothetical protein
MSTTYRSEATGLAVTTFFGGEARGLMVEICGLRTVDGHAADVVALSVEHARELVRLLREATGDEEREEAID